MQVMLPWNCSQASGSCWACFAFSGVMGLSANRQRLFQEQRRGEEILHVNKWMRFLSFLQGSKKAKEETQYSIFWKVKTAYVFRGLRVGNGSLLSFWLPQINVKENAYFLPRKGVEEALL